MVLPRYLAMTREEIETTPALPDHPAWMACHFSPYGTGLSNLPPVLPAGSMVILNDRIPIGGHDLRLILNQLQQLPGDCLLLDFQRPEDPETASLTALILREFQRPVGVSHLYAPKGDCPVLLPPPPPDEPLETYLQPWQGRELWLELGLSRMCWHITPNGAQKRPLEHIPAAGMEDRALCCHYRIDPSPQQADFAIWRTREDLDVLLEQAPALGVTRTVGLWQELVPADQ